MSCFDFTLNLLIDPVELEYFSLATALAAWLADETAEPLTADCDVRVDGLSSKKYVAFAHPHCSLSSECVTFDLSVDSNCVQPLT